MDADYPVKWITADLAVGYAPRSADDLHAVRSAGIGAIVNLCAECYDLHAAEADAGFAVHHLPVTDEDVPDMADLIAAIDWMASRIAVGSRVLVHCRYGIGRTGTVVLAYLLRSGHDIAAARRMMQHTPSWPANRRQEDLIERFAADIGREVGDRSLSMERPGTATFFQRWRAFLNWQR